MRYFRLTYAIISAAGLAITLAGCDASETADRPSRTVDYPSGSYAFFPSDTRAQSIPLEEFNKICKSISLVKTLFEGVPDYYSSFYGTIYQDIITNNGAKLGRPYIKEGACRVNIRFSGDYKGDSYNFDKDCRVTKLEVSEDKKVSLVYVDDNDCE